MSITSAPIQKQTKAEAMAGADKVSPKKVQFYVDANNRMFAIIAGVHYTLAATGAGADALLTLTATV